MATGPGRILGLPRGVAEGMPANLTLVDPDRTWTVKAAALHSKSRNTPFDGWNLTGRAVMTIVDGRIVHE
jgi:dihydroorotase